MGAAAASCAIVLAGGWRWREGWSELPYRYARGAVVLHLVFLASQWLGWRWSAGFVLVGAASGWLLGRRLPPPPDEVHPRAPFRWGLALALLAGAVLCLGAERGWFTQPDFHYHWGLKAARYFIHGGVDYDFLQSPSAWRTHPDYPNLAPELLLVPGFFLGRFDEGAALLVAASWVVLVLVGLGPALRAGGLQGSRLEISHAWIACVLVGFAAGHPVVGSADALPALAGLVALPVLVVGRSCPQAASRLAFAAALAASAKIEGIPLAALILVAGSARLRSESLEDSLKLLSPAWLLVAAVVVPWWVRAKTFDLFLPSNLGPLEFSRIPDILATMLQVASLPEWSGVPWLLLLLPLGWIERKLRPALFVGFGYLGTMMGAYLTAEGVDLPLLVATSFPRLLFQLMPTALVVLSVAGVSRCDRKCENRDS